MTIEVVKVRAEVSVGSIVVSTPFIQSFNVRKERGKISTFDATLKIPYTSSADLAGGDVQIKAGEGSASNLIFTGICRAAKVSPCYNDPYYVILSISGADKLSLLQGKKFTRRCRATNAMWCAITSVTRPGIKSGKFSYGNERCIEISHGVPQKQNNVTGSKGENSLVNGKSNAPPDSGKVLKPTPNIEIQSQNS